MHMLKESLWGQFGAAIDMVERAVLAVPDDLWETDKRFFYQSHHVLVFLDYYLAANPDDFTPYLPMQIAEQGEIPEHALGDVLPERFFSRAELLEYLAFGRSRCHALIESLTPESLSSRWVEEGGGMDYALLEIILYNMRHVQHHAAHLNMLLRETVDATPGWVGRVGE